MAMQTDVKSTKPLTATGSFKTQTDADITFRTRLKGLYCTNGVSAGSVVISDGNGGDTLLTVNTPLRPFTVWPAAEIVTGPSLPSIVTTAGKSTTSSS